MPQGAFRRPPVATWRGCQFGCALERAFRATGLRCRRPSPERGARYRRRLRSSVRWPMRQELRTPQCVTRLEDNQAALARTHSNPRKAMRFSRAHLQPRARSADLLALLISCIALVCSNHLVWGSPWRYQHGLCDHGLGIWWVGQSTESGDNWCTCRPPLCGLRGKTLAGLHDFKTSLEIG